MSQESNTKTSQEATVSMSSGTVPGASPGVATVTNPTFPGAINLTITNAANIQSLPGGQGMKIPIIAAPPHAVNLKIPSPLNLRMAQPATSLPQSTNPNHIMAQRHPVLFSTAQLRPGQTPMLQSIGSQIPVTQLTQQGGTPIIPQNAILPPGARLISAQQLQQGQVIANMRPLRPQGQSQITNKQGQVGNQNPIQLNAATSIPAGSTIVSNITSIPIQSSSLGVTSFNASGLPAHALLVTAPITSGMGLTNAGAHLVPAAQINLNLPTTGAVTQTPQGNATSANISKEGSTTPAVATSQVPAESSTQVAGRNTPEIRKTQQENKMSKEDKSSKEEKEKNNSESNDNKESDFDPASALDWENGIGTLPGSNLKFKLNEFGVMELVSDELECTETMDTSGNTEKDDEEKSSISENSDTGVTGVKVKEEARSPKDKKISGEISQCESCGTYGMPSEFCFAGRFCSKVCAANFANRKQHKIKHTSGDKPLLAGLKKKKKRSFDDDDVYDESTKVFKAEADDGTARKVPALTIAKKIKGFSWSNYLESEKAIGAHPKLFKGQAFPAAKTGFKVGMRLEGIDPKHPTLYCVLSVTEVRGYRIRLHFDGYSECYDFWTNADSPFIFPVGWAEKNGKTLQPPKGYTSDTFTWSSYLKAIRQIAAHKSLFTNTQATSVTPHGFRAGLKLEAVDKTDMALTCVATVKDVLGDRTLIHFDGWEDSYDYWCDPSSPYVHPVGWCQENLKPLSPPNDWPDIEGFTWEDYLAHTKATPVPARAFKVRAGHSFEVGMKLEAVDPKNPILIRVATLVQVETYRMLIHFDGWDSVYDFWSDDDNPDIHPPGWCAKTGHPLEPPISPSEIAHSPSQSGCPTPGCKGVGHVKGAKYTGHHSAFGCPYSQINMIKEGNIPDRLGSGRQSHAPDTPVEPTSANKIVKSFDYPPASPEIQKKCPTPGCDGQGHVTGKYTNHHRLSGCPLYEKNIEKMKKTQHSLPTFTQAPINGETGRPLFGPGSGRGRKKKTLIKAWREQEANKEAAIQNGIHQSIFMSSIVPNPDKEQSLCWDQHSKLLPGVNKHRLSEVESWGTEEVAKFVSELPGCKDHGKTFLDEQIDGEAFLLLNQNDIVKIMNVKLGPALKIYNSILMVKNNVDI